MPRYNVQYKNKWACFSSIIDDFVTCFLDKYEYEKWLIKRILLSYMKESEIQEQTFCKNYPHELLRKINL